MTSTFEVSQGYISLPIIANPNTMIQQAIAAIQAQLPGWVPSEGHIEMILLEQFAAMAAQSANVAASASQAIFEYFGQLVGINPNSGAPATALTTWTMVDNAGYTVPVGTVVGYQLLGNQISLFSTTQEFSTGAASPGRTIPNAQVTLNSPLIYDSGNSFTQEDVGKTVDDGSVNIPGGTLIESVQSYDQATMTNDATGSAFEAVTLGALAGSNVATNVEIQAQSTGTANNNLPTGPLSLITSFGFVSTVVSTTVSSGGADGETSTQYINRLSQELQLLAPRPILPTDYAIIAASVPGVTRATAYNNTFAGVDNLLADVTSGSNIITLYPQSTVDVGSNGVFLPSPTIDIVSTGEFGSSGTIFVQSSTGFQSVTYSGVSGNTLTGCQGGSGQLTTGDVVSGSTLEVFPFYIGLPITGAGIASATTISAWLNPVQLQLSNVATGNEVGTPLTIESETNVERAVAVSALDASGNPVSATIAANVVDTLADQREINFMVSYLQPSYVDIYVNYIAISEPNVSPVALQSGINAAITNFLNPANWAGGAQQPPVWDTTITSVYYLSIAGVIENVPGVQSIQVVTGTPSLGLGTSPNPSYGYNDVSLVQSIGVALPSLQAVSGTVLQGS
jgi:hypothetical protein